MAEVRIQVQYLVEVLKPFHLIWKEWTVICNDYVYMGNKPQR
jgi:hypothetical protein